MGFQDLENAMGTEDEITRKKTKYMSSITSAYGSNPDEEAAKLVLEKKTGIPSILMDEKVKDDAKFQSFVNSDTVQNIPDNSPATAKFLSDPVNARIAHDDVENMSVMEKAFSVLKNTGKSLSSVPSSASQGLWGVGRAVGDIDALIRKPLDSLFESVTGIKAMPRLDERSAFWQQEAKKTAESIKGDRSKLGLAERGFYSGVESLGQNLLTLPLTIISGGSATPMLASMSATAGGQAYGEARDKGVNVGTSLNFGMSQGLIEYATELIPALKFVGNLNAKASLSKMARDMAATEIPGEQVATILQNLNEWAVLNPEKPFRSYLEELPPAMAETLIATVVGSGGMIVTAKGLEKVGASVDKFQTATTNRDFLLALGDSTQASKLRERMPEKLQEAIKSMQEEHGAPEHAYVDAKKLTELWQSAGFDPLVKADVMLSNPKEYFEALATGSEIAIPLDEFARQFAGEDYYQSLVDDVRLGIGSATIKEAQEWEKTGKDEALQGLIDEASAMAPTESDKKVFDDVLGQLLGTNMERGTAERNTQVMQAVFRALGKRTGIDPLELYKQYPLTINRPLPGVLSNRDTFDTVLDPLLDRLRSGDIPSVSKAYGPSLLEFLRDKGISDDRGDLKAMDVDKGMKAFTKKLLREDGLPIDKAREAAVEAGYLPQGADINVMLDAISGELQGQPKYSGQNQDSKVADDLINLQQVKDYLDRVGVDLLTMDNKSVRQELGKQRELFQSKKEIKRGFFRFGDGTFNIGLLGAADLSTFMHESSHFYLEILADLASQEATPQQVKDDFAAILKWTGATSREGMTVAQLEQFARGFEAYLMEGKSPSIELQSVFQRMKAWMVQVYKELRNLGVKLNDDVRGVFDRLVASDEEIEAARTRQNMKDIFATAEDMGVSEAEFAIYRKAGEKAHASQIEKLEREYLEELTRQKKAWWREELSKTEIEVEKETRETLTYKAIQVLTKGTTFDGVEMDLKLDRKMLEKQYGKSLVKRLPRGIYAKENGMTADQLAEMTGFDSGDDLVKQIAATPQRREFIKAESERRMKEVYGDMLTDGTAAEEATNAVHVEEQAKVLLEELRAMRKLQSVVDKVDRADNKERNQIFKGVPPAEFFKDLARDMVTKKTIAELMPHRYSQAEAKASREAFDAAKKKDWQAAAEAKQRQILNHYLFREATNIKKMVDKQVSRWQELVNKSDKRLAASRDMNLVTAARAVLARYGIGKSDVEATAELNKIRAYDANLYDSLQMAVDSASQAAKPWKELDVIELIGLSDAVNNLWHLSRRSKIAMIDGQAMTLEEINDDLIAQMASKNKGLSGLGKNKAVSDTEKRKIGFLGMGASLRRVEHWITEMDGGDSGVFRKYVYNPIMLSVTNYKTAKVPVIKQLQELFDSVGFDAFSDKKIEAVGLNYTFKNKGELLHAILHTGNESNKRKLLLGRGWAETVEGSKEIDTTRWDNFLNKMHENGTLTESDYQFAQKIWDLNEELKPVAQKAHHEMYGYYFAEITAEPVSTPFGIFKGGYVPALTDPYIVDAAADRLDQESLLQDNASSMFPATTGKGFTMARVEYNKPLLLDMSLLASHVDKVLRFAYMGPAIQDVGRIVSNSELREEFNQINPAWTQEMLIPWLKRIARQTVETKSSGWGGKAVDNVLRGLRRRTGLQLMAANIANAAQQLTGVFPAMVKVSPRRIGASLVQFTKNPMALTDSIAEKSPFMKDRLENEINHISGEVHQILSQSKYEKAQEFGMKAGYFLSGATQHVVDVITWQGAYDQATKEGQQEKEAVLYADSVVRQTQGSFAPEDASAFEAGSPFVRLFTQFYSYFNMISNLTVTEMRNTVDDLGWKGGSAKLFYIYLMTFAIPSFVAELIMAGFKGKLDDDDDGEYIDDILKAFFVGQGKAATAMIPGVGQVINTMVNRFNKNPIDDRMSTSPSIGTLEQMGSVPKDIYDVVFDGKELKRAHVRDVFTLMGMVTGLPTAALARPLGYAVAAESGKTQPANSLDYMRGLITGYAPKP